MPARVPAALHIVFDARSVVAHRSGIGTYAETLLRHMVPKAPDVRFVVLRHPDARTPIAPDVEELTHPGESKSIRTVLTLGRMRDGFAGFDLYHSPADLVPLGLRCPWVVTVHDLMWIEAPRLASAFLPVRLANALWYRATIGHAVRGARAVIAISEATKQAIERIYPQASDRTHVVHHGLERERYAIDVPRSVLDAQVPPGCRFSLCVGQGSPYKNHLRMVRAFVEATAGDDEHKLVLVRRFARIDFAMRRLLRRPEVARKVIVLPHVDDRTLLALYRHARMLLFASLYEGFGMPALEAMAAGTPLLGSTAPAVREVAGDAALVAVPDDHRDLVDKIRRLDHDEALRARLVEAGRRRVERFSWERAAEQTLEIYRDAARSCSTAATLAAARRLA